MSANKMLFADLMQGKNLEEPTAYGSMNISCACRD